MRLLVLALATMWLTGNASAQPANLAQATGGYLYFNRSGATIEEHDRDLRNCSEVAANNYITAARLRAAQSDARVAPPPGYTSVGPVGAWIVGGVNDMMLGGWERAHRNVATENCMIVRGWRLVRLPDRQGQTLAELGRDQLRIALSPPHQL